MSVSIKRVCWAIVLVFLVIDIGYLTWHASRFYQLGQHCKDTTSSECAAHLADKDNK